jgi:hypothetical protein
MTSIAQEVRARTDKQIYLKSFFTAKEPITRIKRQPMEWEKNLFQLFTG